MIVYLEGQLVQVKTGSFVMDVGGIGYEVHAPTSVLADLPKRGETLLIHTYHYVREDMVMLYGFNTEAGLEVFKRLITVSGIGPKGALALLSTVSLDELKFAVMTDDATILARAPGIGKKTAQRLIIDLKDKLDLSADPLFVGATASMPTDHKLSARSEAIEALMALGYNSQMATAAVKKVQDFDQVEDLIGQALKQL